MIHQGMLKCLCSLGAALKILGRQPSEAKEAQLDASEVAHGMVWERKNLQRIAMHLLTPSELVLVLRLVNA
jgi:hypothetical protein